VASAPDSVSARHVQRRKTYEQVYAAAVAEIARVGRSAADVGAIAAAAGVARGTFYFHFPTKEHVLLELERREEQRIVAGLARRAVAGDLRAVLPAIVQQIRAAERRLGPRLFREMLAVHFSAASPDGGRLQQHPLATFLIDAVRTAQAAGAIAASLAADAVAATFLTGLFGLLAAGEGPGKARDALLDAYVKIVLDGVTTP
jgi:AcrR family transcriptional regulator